MSERRNIRPASGRTIDPPDRAALDGGRSGRRAALLGVLLLVGVLSPLVPSPSNATAAASPAIAPTKKLQEWEKEAAKVNWPEFELRVVAVLNDARLHPENIATALETLKEGKFHNLPVFPDGNVIYATPPFRSQSIKEARSQPPRPALAWSEKLSQRARSALPLSNHGNSAKRSEAAGLTGLETIEALGQGDPSPEVAVYTQWISEDEWKFTTTAVVDYIPAPHRGERGHRGIINDNRMTAIGVACEPRSPLGGGAPVSVKCAIDTGIDIPDQSPVVPMASGAPVTLSQLPKSIDGSIGTRSLPGQTSVSVNTSAPTTTTDPSLGRAPNLVPLVPLDASLDPASTATTPSTTTTTAPVVRAGTTIYGVQAAKDCASIPAPEPGKVRVRFLNQDPTKEPAEDLETDLFLYDVSTPRSSSVPQFAVPAGTTFDVEATPGTAWRWVTDSSAEIRDITVGSGPTQCDRGDELERRASDDRSDRYETECNGIEPAAEGTPRGGPSARAWWRSAVALQQWWREDLAAIPRSRGPESRYD